jgi:thioredoxin 1
MVHEIKTQVEFDEKVAKTKGLVLVDFYAQWCGPCKRFAPTLEKLSKEYTNVSFYKVDVDVVPQESITAMPTFVLYRDRTEVGRVTGANENNLVSLLTTQ